MALTDYIINDIEIQPVSQKISDLKNIFDELIYSHLPVSEDGVYIGSISESDVRCFDASKSLKDYRYALSSFFTRPSQPLLEILRIFAVNDTNILPVLQDETNAYLGYLELTDVLSILQETPFFGEEGNIIVVEKGEKDYSFSELSQIVESNDGKLFGLYINKFSEGIVQITLKLSHHKMNEILQSLRRYDYTILTEHEEDTFLQELKERSDYLNKYLNI